MALAPDIRAKLLANLPSDYAKQAYEHFGGKYSLSLIRRVAHGSRNNDEIMDFLISLAETKRRTLQEFNERVANL